MARLTYNCTSFLSLLTSVSLREFLRCYHKKCLTEDYLLSGLRHSELLFFGENIIKILGENNLLSKFLYFILVIYPAGYIVGALLLFWGFMNFRERSNRMSPYKSRILLLAIVFGIAIPGILLFVPDSFYVIAILVSQPLNLMKYYLLSYAFFVMFYTTAFALLYWRIEKHIHGGHGKIGAVMYLIFLSLAITVFPWILPSWMSMMDMPILSLLIFIVGVVWGIIIIFQTYHGMSRDKLLSDV